MTAHNLFDEKLSVYYRNIMYMGTMVEQFLLDVIDAYAAKDAARAKELIEVDRKIDEMQVQLEQESVMLLLLQSPVATDLRKIVTSIKIIANLERIGDYSVHLAKLAVKGDPSLYAQFAPRVARMAKDGALMIRDSLTAYIEDNEELAMATAAKDAAIDAQKKEIINELIMLRPENEAQMKQISRFLSICKDLERLGDHITTICEWVIFAVKGELVDLNRSAKSAE
jgi:phosphate transport system protein